MTDTRGNFLLSGPSTFPLALALLELLEILKPGTNTDLTVAGPGRAASLVSETNLTFGDLALFGGRMNPRHRASLADRFFFPGRGAWI